MMTTVILTLHFTTVKMIKAPVMNGVVLAQNSYARNVYPKADE
jgi:hypothetical protein